MAEPVTFAEAAAHLRLAGDTSEQALIESYIVAAREWVENYTGHILVQREITEQRDSFGRYIELHRRPVVSITSVGYIDTDGAAQAYADGVYSLDRYPARVHPAYDGSWPTVGRYGGVTVTYLAGYAVGEEPQALIQAMLLLVGHWFDRRSAVSQDAANEVPFAVQALVDQYRTPEL